MTGTAATGVGSARVRNGLYGLVGLGIGALFLFLTARNVDLDEAATIISEVSLLWTLPLTLAYLLNLSLRCVRWHLMFPDEHRPTPRHTVDAFMIGKLGNNVLPGRMGEMLRAMAIGRTVPAVGITGALATVVVEKVLDALAILAMLGLALTFAPLPAWAQQTGLGMLVTFPAVLLGLVILDRNHHLFDRFERLAAGDGTLRRWLRWLLTLPAKFSSGLHTVRRGKHFLAASLMTVGVWTLETIIIYICFMAFDIELGMGAAMVTLALLTAGSLLPSAPGFIGTYQLFIVSALSLYGIDETNSFAMSVFLNIYVMSLTTILGVIALLMEGGLVDFRRMIGNALNGRSA